MLNISWTEVVKKIKRYFIPKYVKSMYTVFIELPLRCYNECHGKVFVHTNFDVTQKNACGESFMLSASLDIKFV